MNSNIDGSAIINKFLEADNLTDEQMEDMLTLAELFADMSVRTFFAFKDDDESLAYLILCLP